MLKDATMRMILAVAGLFHLILGASAVLWPSYIGGLAGLPAREHSVLWQYAGAITFVFGLAYALAAADPLRHWLLTLTGLGVKLPGPIGFVYAAYSERISWDLGWTFLVHDVIWWAPLGLILKRAWDEHLERLRSWTPEVLSFALRTRTDKGFTIEQLSRVNPVLLVFLRHAGCTFCREALADIARQRESLRAAGVAVVLVHMGDEENGRALFARYGLDDLPRISDTSSTVYRAFGLRRGTLRMLIGPTVWWRGFDAAFLQRHGFGRWIGDGFQMPGIFLVFHGHIIRSFRHQSAADRPDYVRFVREAMSEAVP